MNEPTSDERQQLVNTSRELLKCHETCYTLLAVDTKARIDSLKNELLDLVGAPTVSRDTWLRHD